MSNSVDLKQAVETTVSSKRDIRKVAIAGGLGTLIEYYDYALYGYVATIIAPLFFPSEDPVASLLSTLAVFALSYVIRPLGGVFFGWLGDRKGRRNVLLVTVIGIGLANTALGLLPTYASIGVLAPVLLVLVRITQGFFAGGEVGGAATVISEAAPDGKRNLFGAFTPMGTNGGFAIASGVIGVVSGLMSLDDLSSWGWRIPFLIGLPLTVMCYLARRALPDIDEDFDKDSKDGFPLWSAIKEQPVAILKGIGLGVGVQGGAYIGSTFIAIYLVSDLHYPNTFVYWLTAGVTVAAVLLMPLTGRLADKIGSIPVALIGLVGYAALTFPAFVLMGVGSFLLASLGYMLVMVNMSFLQVASYTLTPRLFDDKVRYTGTALVTNISVVIAGGTAPYIGTLLVEKTGDLRSPYYFVALTSLIGIFAVVAIWRRRSKMHW